MVEYDVVKDLYKLEFVPWNSLRCRYGLLGRLSLVAGTPMIWWKYQCFHLIIMGVALDVHVSQARWQKLKNMSADALVGSIISFPKICNATFSVATKTS